MVFELGKTYEFTDGKLMKIAEAVDSAIYTKCLIGETDHGDFIPVRDTDEYTINWKETENQMVN